MPYKVAKRVASLTGDACTAPVVSEFDTLLAWLDDSLVPVSPESPVDSAFVHETVAFPPSHSLAVGGTTTASTATTLLWVGTLRWREQGEYCMSVYSHAKYGNTR